MNGKSYLIPILKVQGVNRFPAGLTDPNNPEPDETEIQMRHNMEEEKTKYGHAFPC